MALYRLHRPKNSNQTAQSDVQPISIEPEHTSTNVHRPSSDLNLRGQRNPGDVDEQTPPPERTGLLKLNSSTKSRHLSKQKEEVEENRDNLLQELQAMKTSLDVAQHGQ